jgi:hypothetical protein
MEQTTNQNKHTKATLKIHKLTDEINGYGMPIVDVISDENLVIINRGYNEFEAVTEIDESDLFRLRGMFSMFSNETIMLRITTPERVTNAWYKLCDVYLGKNNTCIIW